jgi:hypothetical protein
LVLDSLLERRFAELTNRKLRRSAHRSVTEPEADIRKWISECNTDPKLFVWTKTMKLLTHSPLTADDQRRSTLG